MKVCLYAFALLIFTTSAFAQDSLLVSLDKTVYQPGDSIHWQCALKTTSTAPLTIQLWIENTETGKQWQYRYPILKGYAEGNLHIPDSMAKGRYAFNFILQNDFFNCTGKLLNHRVRDSVINCYLIFKDKEEIINSTRAKADGSFRLKNFLFQDTALCLVSVLHKDPDKVSVVLKTTLDSSFVPAAIVTKIVTIGIVADATTPSKSSAETNYTFDYKSKFKNYFLPEVVISGKGKKKLQEYEKEYVSGFFRSADETTFNGLDNDDISRSRDIYFFLQGHVAGLQVATDPETGERELTWRKQAVTVYIDEYKVDEDRLTTVQPTEVAMIKILRPGSGDGFSIAIYTKLGVYADAGQNKSRFFLRGYNALNMEWN